MVMLKMARTSFFLCVRVCVCRFRCFGWEVSCLLLAAINKIKRRMHHLQAWAANHLWAGLANMLTCKPSVRWSGKQFYATFRLGCSASRVLVLPMTKMLWRSHWCADASYRTTGLHEMLTGQKKKKPVSLICLTPLASACTVKAICKVNYISSQSCQVGWWQATGLFADGNKFHTSRAFHWNTNRGGELACSRCWMP